MAGIAHIIQGADFSNSPLGQVTLVRSAAEEASDVVTAYTNLIGDNTYSGPLVTMVQSLIENGLWNDLDVYPMLGNTVSKLCINLNPDKGFIKAPIVTVDGAFEVGDDNKYIKSTKLSTDATQFPTTGVVNKTLTFEDSTDISGTYWFFDVKRTTSSGGIVVLQRMVRGSSLGGWIQTTAPAGTNNGTIPRIEIGTTTPYQYVARATSSLTNTRHRVEIIANSNVFNIAIDDVSDIDSENSSPTYTLTNTSLTRNNTILTMFEGECRFFAQGVIDHTKFNAVNTIFKTFLDAVKPNE